MKKSNKIPEIYNKIAKWCYNLWKSNIRISKIKNRFSSSNNKVIKVNKTHQTKIMVIKNNLKTPKYLKN